MDIDQKIPINRQNLHSLKKVEQLGFDSLDDFLVYMFTVEREKPSHIAKFLLLSHATVKKYQNLLKLPTLKKIEFLGPAQLQEYEYTDRCLRCDCLITNIYHYKNLKRSERSCWCEHCRKLLFGEDKR